MSLFNVKDLWWTNCIKDKIKISITSTILWILTPFYIGIYKENWANYLLLQLNFTKLWQTITLFNFHTQEWVTIFIIKTCLMPTGIIQNSKHFTRNYELISILWNILVSKTNVEQFLDSFMKKILCYMMKAYFPILMNRNS